MVFIIGFLKCLEGFIAKLPVRLSFALIFIGFNVTFFPQFILGFFRNAQAVCRLYPAL